MRTFWHYSGDVNIECGGVFYALDNWHYDYANFVRVTPCSDAGGPNNEWWVEVGTVNVPDRDSPACKQALDCIGMTEAAYGEHTRARRRHILFDALLCYGRYDIESSRRIRIGKNAESHSHHWDETAPDDVLRGNVSLQRYVRGVIRNGF